MIPCDLLYQAPLVMANPLSGATVAFCLFLGSYMLPLDDGLEVSVTTTGDGVLQSSEAGEEAREELAEAK